MTEISAASGDSLFIMFNESRSLSSGGIRYLCVIEDAAAIVGTDDGVLPILAEVGSCDEACLPVHLIP